MPRYIVRFDELGDQLRSLGPVVNSLTFGLTFEAESADVAVALFERAWDSVVTPEGQGIGAWHIEPVEEKA